MITLLRLGRAYTGFLPKTDPMQFAERILGNYELMQMRFPAEAMIHAVLSPYQEQETAQEQTLGLVQNIQIQQKACLHVVNQLVNRMQAMSRGCRNYRDGVFVEICLRKLGIRHHRELIQMILKEAGISDYRHELVRLLDGTETKFCLLEKEQRGRRPWRWKGRKPGHRPEEEESRYYLHNQVFQRLHLRELYQSLSLLRGGSARGLTAPGPEFSSYTENLRFTDSLFALRLNEAVFGLKETEMLQSFNPYEKWSTGTGAVKGDIQESLISAMLLNLTRDARIYTCGAFGRYPGTGRSFWIDLKEAAQESGKKTQERFFFYHRSLLSADMENQRALMEVIQDGFAREVRILNHIRDKTGRQEQEEDTRELRKTGKLITQILKERQEVLQEELLMQTGRMLHEVSRMEEEIRRYVSDTELHYVTVRQQADTGRVRLVHIQRETGRDGHETNDVRPLRENRSMSQNVSVRDLNYSDQKTLRLDLAERSKKEVSRLVRDNIQEQMNVLSDKVYSRLEQRLAGEKKRRGI